MEKIKKIGLVGIIQNPSTRMTSHNAGHTYYTCSRIEDMFGSYPDILNEKDTPCTLSIGFSIIRNKLNMHVTMRSNDLWYGFCNDQYCFSKLLEMVALELGLEIGWYYHYAANLHIYEKHYNVLHKLAKL